MLVEPLSNLPNHLHIARSLSAVYSNPQVMNTNPSPVKIYKGMKLATAIPERNILLVSDEDLEAEVQMPNFNHLQFPNLSLDELRIS